VVKTGPTERTGVTADAALLAEYFRLLTAYADFKHARKIAELIIEDELHRKMAVEGPTHLEALNCAMVIAYTRPFARGNSRRGADSRPLATRYINHYGKEERGLHDILIHERNKYLAHSDIPARDFKPEVWRVGDKTMVAPWSRDTRAPLTLEYVTMLRRISATLVERVLKERMRIEPSVVAHFPEIDVKDLL
jgi:hypothetical protein